MAKTTEENPFVCTSTPQDYDKWKLACDRAKALAKLMGPGWTARVWENLGWYYEVISPCGRVDVYASHCGAETSYTAYLHAKGGNGMSTALGHPQHDKDPKKAVRKLVRHVRGNLAKMQALVEGL